jgi:hypothetical protein
MVDIDNNVEDDEEEEEGEAKLATILDSMEWNI